MTEETGQAGSNAAPAEDRIVKTVDTNVAVPKPIVTEAPKEEAKVETEEAAETEESGETGGDAAEKPKKKGGFQRKIDKLSQDFYALQAENQRIAEENNRLRTPKTTYETEPTLEKFSTVEDFVKAHRDWAIDEGKKVAKADYQKEQERKTYQTRAAAFQVREDEARTKYTDYNQSVAQIAPIVLQTPALKEYILESEEGPDLAYHLAKNPAVLTSLMQMTGLQALRELTRIEGKLGQSPPPKAQTKAPEPIKPVGSSEKAPFDADKADFMTFKQRRNAEERKRKA